MTPSLSRKLLVVNAGLALCLAAVGVVLAWELHGLKRTVDNVVDEYKERGMIDSVVRALLTSRTILETGTADREAVLAGIREASERLAEFAAYQPGESSADESHQEAEHAKAERVAADLEAAIGDLGDADSAILPPERADRLARRLDRTMGRLADLASETDIGGASDVVATRIVTTNAVVWGAFGAIVLGSIVASIIWYVAVVRPLRRLHTGVRRIAAGEFRNRLPERGDREFRDLAGDFNLMAEELEASWRDLEEKVRTKSRELVRSERLASVGFLAAGVAHEINNPLNIISGYAELTERSLRDGADPASPDEVRDALEIIRDEAFRCKEITRKLLSLAKGGDGSRSRLSLADLADDVVSMLRGLQRYGDRRIEIVRDAEDALEVRGNEVELKQVLLNLLLNACEAVEPGDGEVHVTCAREGDLVRVCVSDNGRGMSRNVLERVFEPFFSGGNGHRGTGLGLSISHAIVTDHGGRLRAESDGPSRGSRFSIELPAVAGSDADV